MAKRFTTAAPVGVVYSPSRSPEYAGIPSRMREVAGAGTGMTPWAQVTWPNPVLSGEATTLSGDRRSISMQTPTTSATASSAPTSWKWTMFTGSPWTLDSASAMVE